MYCIDTGKVIIHKLGGKVSLVEQNTVAYVKFTINFLRKMCDFMELFSADATNFFFRLKHEKTGLKSCSYTPGQNVWSGSKF